MVAQNDQSHMVTNNPTKFEQNLLHGLRGVASKKCDKHMDGQMQGHQFCYVPFSVILHFNLFCRDAGHMARSCLFVTESDNFLKLVNIYYIFH